MPSYTQGWGGRVGRGGKGAPSPPSSCNTGLKQIQRTICMSLRPIPHYSCSSSQEPLGRIRNMQLQLRVNSCHGKKLELSVNFKKMSEEGVNKPVWSKTYQCRRSGPNLGASKRKKEKAGYSDLACSHHRRAGSEEPGCVCGAV